VLPNKRSLREHVYVERKCDAATWVERSVLTTWPRGTVPIQELLNLYVAIDDLTRYKVHVLRDGSTCISIPGVPWSSWRTFAQWIGLGFLTFGFFSFQYEELTDVEEVELPTSIIPPAPYTHLPVLVQSITHDISPSQLRAPVGYAVIFRGYGDAAMVVALSTSVQYNQLPLPIECSPLEPGDVWHDHHNKMFRYRNLPTLRQPSFGAFEFQVPHDVGTDGESSISMTTLKLGCIDTPLLETLPAEMLRHMSDVTRRAGAPVYWATNGSASGFAPGSASSSATGAVRNLVAITFPLSQLGVITEPESAFMRSRSAASNSPTYLLSPPTGN